MPENPQHSGVLIELLWMAVMKLFNNIPKKNKFLMMIKILDLFIDLNLISFAAWQRRKRNPII